MDQSFSVKVKTYPRWNIWVDFFESYPGGMGSSISHVWWVLLKVFVIKVTGVNVEVSREAPLSVQRNIVQRCSKLLSPRIFQCLAQISSRREPGFFCLFPTNIKPWAPHLMCPTSPDHGTDIRRRWDPKSWMDPIHFIGLLFGENINSDREKGYMQSLICIYILYIFNDKLSNPIWPFFFFTKHHPSHPPMFDPRLRIKKSLSLHI